MVRMPLHLVSPSPWPLLGGLTGLTLTSSLVAIFHGLSFGMMGLLVGMSMMILVMYQWWRDVVRESVFEGFHTSVVVRGLKLGMILFIVSEIMFFFGFFWAFFHASLSPTWQLGCVWPPAGITPINPFSIPLLNTATLLASGVTVTLAHHSILAGNLEKAKLSLLLTIMLGIYFTYLQAMEYSEAPFSIADSVYGSTFFVATGFHGLHVLIGSTVLTVSLFRLFFHNFSSSHHFGFEAAAWYWHFVDVVWIALYICLYWWGS